MLLFTLMLIPLKLSNKNIAALHEYKSKLENKLRNIILYFEVRLEFKKVNTGAYIL